MQELVAHLDWFQERGYFLHLAENKEVLSKNSLDLFTESYALSYFDRGLGHLNETKYTLSHGLEKLAHLEKNWGFNLLKRYEILLT